MPSSSLSPVQIDPRPIRLAIASQRRLICLGIEAMFAPDPDIEFVGTAPHPSVIRVYVLRGMADVMICAWGRYGAYSRPTLEEFAGKEGSPKFIILGEHADPEIVREVFLLGASGFVAENCDDSQIADAVRAVAAGRIVIETGAKRLQGKGVGSAADPGTLTERERSVITLIASGLSTKQVAQALFLSPKTVETHRANIMRKLDLTSVADAVRYAMRTGLLTPTPDEQDSAG